MPKPTNPIEFPTPAGAWTGNRFLASTKRSLTAIAKLWRPSGTNMAADAAVLSLVALRVVDRTTGIPYSADELPTTKKLQISGSDPAFSAAVNTAAIQAALDVGGEIRMTTPGTYNIAGPLKIGSNTSLRLANGVILKTSGATDNLLQSKAYSAAKTSVTLTWAAGTGGVTASMCSVAWTGHGLVEGDYVWITGVNQSQYLGVFRITTRTDADNFVVSLQRAPTTSPAFIKSLHIRNCSFTVAWALANSESLMALSGVGMAVLENCVSSLHDSSKLIWAGTVGIVKLVNCNLSKSSQLVFVSNTGSSIIFDSCVIAVGVYGYSVNSDTNMSCSVAVKNCTITGCNDAGFVRGRGTATISVSGYGNSLAGNSGWTCDVDGGSGTVVFQNKILDSTWNYAYAATVTPNLGWALNVTIGALTGALTIANPAAAGFPPAGTPVTVMLVQDGTGGRAVTWGTKYKFPTAWSNSANTAGTRSCARFVSDGTYLWAQGANIWA